MRGALNRNMKPIWIVDDDESIRWVLEKALARENLATRSFSNARDVMDAFQTSVPQVLVSDIRMPGESGLELLQTVKTRYPGLPVIIITAFSDLDSAVAAFQGGAFEYLAKPFDIDKAVGLIRRALEESMRESDVEQAPADTPEILGQAPAMQDMFRAIGRLSQSNVTVLITGESGTGKELVARALHKHSPRAEQPYIALNTAAIPKDLLESELFGHERGAFTGAQAMRRGRFEQAENGTLFLDEIGDMPFDLQTRLLRVLSDGHFYRVGGHQPLKANVRLEIAARLGAVRVEQGDAILVRSVPDEAPKVTVDGAPATHKIAELDALPVLYRATDDHGLRQVDLVLRSAGREERRVLARLDGDSKHDEGGYQLRGSDPFLAQAYLPVEVVVGTPTPEALSTALAAPTVRAVYCDTWSAADPCGRMPEAAVLTADGRPTPAFRLLQQLRERWLR